MIAHPRKEGIKWGSGHRDKACQNVSDYLYFTIGVQDSCPLNAGKHWRKLSELYCYCRDDCLWPLLLREHCGSCLGYSHWAANVQPLRIECNELHQEVRIEGEENISANGCPTVHRLCEKGQLVGQTYWFYLVSFNTLESGCPTTQML